MIANASLTRKHKRAAFARTLYRLTIRMSVAVGAFNMAGQLTAEQCDRCASHSSEGPSCGCETATHVAPRKKPCVPKPSFAEKIFGQLDKVGDRIESKWKIAHRANCGCEAQGPSCGCEVGPSCGCEVAAPSCGLEFDAIALQHSATAQREPSTEALPVLKRPMPENPNKNAVGSISDTEVKHESYPPAVSPIAKPSKELRTSAPTPPFETAPARVPLEEPVKLNSSNASRPQPTGNESVPSTTRNRSNTPPKQQPTVPSLPPVPPPLQPLDESIPDVLVDPFKDDASVRRTRDQMEGILLISDQYPRSRPSSLRNQRTNKQAGQSMETPPSLSPKQLGDSQIEFDAMEPITVASRSVVPTSYYSNPMEVVVKSKKRPPSVDEGTPVVPKMAVPRSR